MGEQGRPQRREVDERDPVGLTHPQIERGTGGAVHRDQAVGARCRRLHAAKQFDVPVENLDRHRANRRDILPLECTAQAGGHRPSMVHQRGRQPELDTPVTEHDPAGRMRVRGDDRRHVVVDVRVGPGCAAGPWHHAYHIALTGNGHLPVPIEIDHPVRGQRQRRTGLVRAQVGRPGLDRKPKQIGLLAQAGKGEAAR
ncbi:hypothetical protein [Dactylosporangium sp. CA-139066]|uniref:hypothetical protein n=1 Tax=Dactylosporangium sp. CA-139066 TaxID=3239930 RepID=UPI003D92600D